MLKHASVKGIVPIVFLLCIGLISYAFQRHQSSFILPLYFLSFISYWYLIKRKELFTFKSLILLGVLARVMLLPSTPVLSDDVYRFIWDGRLLAEGINPFAQVPSFYINNPTLEVSGLTNELYQLLNSPNNHTIYPPVVQFIFWLSAIIFPDSIYNSIVFIRAFHFLAEFGVLYFSILLLKQLKLPARNIFLYFLNPLVILELTGNIHAEGIMLFFLLGGIFLYHKDKLLLAGVFLALAVATKLIPLIFLPYLLLTTPIRKSVPLFSTLGITTLLLFLPLLDIAFITGMQSSVSLYFQKFEFNASIYYIVREIGYWVKGYNIIETAGKALAICSFVSIMSISVIAARKRWNMMSTLAMILLSYLLFTNILHPWYVIGLMGITIFTNMRFAILWTGVVFATYAGYTLTGFKENIWVVFFEYALVFGVFIYEFINKKPLRLDR